MVIDGGWIVKYGTAGGLSLALHWWNLLRMCPFEISPYSMESEYNWLTLSAIEDWTTFCDIPTLPTI